VLNLRDVETITRVDARREDTCLERTLQTALGDARATLFADGVWKREAVRHVD
jgi:hypothetical protein